MSLFKYIVYTKQGIQSGQTESVDVRTLRAYLRYQGLLPVKIHKIPSRPALASNIESFFTKKVRFKDFVIFCQQLSQIIDADFPVINALQNIADYSNHPTLKKVIMEIASSIEGGDSFGKALEKHSKIFPPLFISSIQAAEEGGNLAKTLNHLTYYYEEQEELRNKIISIIIYPSIVITAVLGIVIAMMVYIVPIFASLYKSFKAELPIQTKILISVSNFFITCWPFFICLILLSIGIYKLVRRTRRGGFFIDRNIFRIPLLGKILHNITLARFIRTFGTSFDAGVVITRSLENSKVVVKNRAVEEVINNIKQNLIGGNTISSGIEQGKWFFPPIIRQMIAIGELSGTLGKMLKKASKNVEDELDRIIKRLINALEPIMTIILGFLVMAISLALYLPLINISKVMFHK